MQNNTSKIIGLGAIVLIAAAGTGAAVYFNRPDTDTSSTETTQTETASTDTATSSNESSTATETAGTYKDGTYSADGSYRSPGGNETIGVTVSLKDNIVTAVDIKTNASGNSAQYQTMFKNGVGNLTVGKNIDEINLSRVSGSSLTSTGFNDALDEIKDEAKA
ncbi:MAG: calcium-binding protein [Chloroflexi bacterium]|nr:MAG: calcium-binding protein [Chloroflexota bacterium]